MPTALRLHNSLTRSIEPFQPIAGPGGDVTFYTCGPTVYDDAHIGNFRAFLAADLLRRTLELIGHRVTHVMNITDVGHMTEDDRADGGGEDKMALAGRRLLEAKKSGALPEDAAVDPHDPFAIADFYANRFLEDARHLGLRVAEEAVDDPSLMPRPTRFVPQMIELVERLIAAGCAYVADDGAVYFDVRSFPAYGRLSGNTLEALRSGEGGRVSEANQSVKRHPADFLLWKPDPTHLMRWPSPWGEGYPGWHLECSAMAAARLGPEIDLHSGGEDNVFPHHECEIAQSCCGYGVDRLARHWFHVRHLFVEGAKMSKSRGNFFTARDLFAKGATPAALRLELLRTHYRTNANFTLQGLEDCRRQVDRWCRLAARLDAAAGDRDPVPTAPAGPLERALETFTESLCDDLNVAGAIAALNTAASASASEGDGACPVRERAALRRMDSVLGVLDRNETLEGGGDLEALEAKVAPLIEARAAARGRKDFAESDRIRDELLAMGVEIKDGPEGTTWTRRVNADA
ncbi:MAG: cysteine--tRNA ligase [Planctomycetota bacterium]